MLNTQSDHLPWLSATRLARFFRIEFGYLFVCSFGEPCHDVFTTWPENYVCLLFELSDAGRDTRYQAILPKPFGPSPYIRTASVTRTLRSSKSHLAFQKDNSDHICLYRFGIWKETVCSSCILAYNWVWTLCLVWFELKGYFVVIFGTCSLFSLMNYVFPAWLCL